MELAKQAVQYYVETTGNTWQSFFDKLAEAVTGDLNTQTGDIWLIHALVNKIKENGVSIQQLKARKDEIKAVFDDSGRKKHGEFFTPMFWAEEAHRYLDRLVPNWRTEYSVWEPSCYSMDTEILTKRGFVTYDNLRDDDLIYSLNPKTKLAEWTGFHDRFKRKYTGNMYTLYNGCIGACVTEDHMQYTLSNDGWRDESTFAIFKRGMLTGRALNGKVTVEDCTEFITGARLTEDETGDIYKSQDFTDIYRLIGALVACYGKYAILDDNIIGFDFEEHNGRGLEFIEDVLIRYSEGASACDYPYHVKSELITDCIRTCMTCDGRLLLDKIPQSHYEHVADGILLSYGVVTDDLNVANMTSVEVPDLYCADILMRLLIFCGRTVMIFQVSEEDGYSISFSCGSVSGLYPSDISVNKVVDEDVWDITLDKNHIFLTRYAGNVIFSKNCGSGNLIKTAGIAQQKLFASTLQQEDVAMVKDMFPEAEIFQLDFLSAVDDGFNNNFVDKLPERLRDIILNDKPLVILANPPYKSGVANATEVGRYMQLAKAVPEYEFNDFSRAAYDLFYQCCFQVMNLVTRFNLSNTYYCFFGPTTLFTGSSAGTMFRKFEHCFEFLDGMCIDAQEFNGTSKDVVWSVSFSCWKSRGGYVYEDNAHKDVLLNKSFVTPDGKVGVEGKVLYEAPRKKLSDWVIPETYSGIGRVEAPLMTSHLTFKGSEVFSKIAPNSGMILPEALGTIMTNNTMTKNADMSAVLSMPTTVQFAEITEENFWRCVASFAFRRSFVAGWAVAKKEISAPNTGVEGYETWVRNALVSFLFEQKAMMSALRGVKWGGYENYVIHNKMFYLSEDEIRACCNDDIIISDLEQYPMENAFMLRQIEESKPFWGDEAWELYNWCVAYTKTTYNLRKSVGYKGSLDCADAGFQQLRSVFDGAVFADYNNKLLPALRNYLKKDCLKYGFLSEVITEE